MTEIPQIQIYFKIVSDNVILNDNPTELAKDNWLKYNNISKKIPII